MWIGRLTIKKRIATILASLFANHKNFMLLLLYVICNYYCKKRGEDD